MEARVKQPPRIGTEVIALRQAIVDQPTGVAVRQDSFACFQEFSSVATDAFAHLAILFMNRDSLLNQRLVQGTVIGCYLYHLFHAVESPEQVYCCGAAGSQMGNGVEIVLP